MKAKLILVLLILAALPACGSDPTGGVERGVLVVITESVGPNIPATYTLNVGGFPPTPISSNGEEVSPPIPVGPYSVELTDLANCAVQGQNPRTVQVVESPPPSETTFNVECT